MADDVWRNSRAHNSYQEGQPTADQPSKPAKGYSFSQEFSKKDAKTAADRLSTLRAQSEELRSQSEKVNGLSRL